MRLLICAGGTGGGVYPALAVLQALKAESGGSTPQESSGSLPSDPLEVLWVGGIGGMEVDLVQKAGIPFEAIPAAGLHGVGLRKLPHNVQQLGRGVLAARRVLRRFRPQVALFTGGYVAAPVALAARLIKPAVLRSLLYVPDIEPGLALKAAACFADCITVTAEDSRAFFPGRRHVVVTGYPTRLDLARWDRLTAQRQLGLGPELPVLLVFGGSKGSRAINRALLAALPDLLGETQVVHIAGSLDWPEVQAARQHMQTSLPPSLLENYHGYPYLHEEMGAALAAADLVVSRAGASTLGEFPSFGLPAVLAPYPYAWRYQQVNANYLAQRGAALVLQDAELPDRLLPVVRELFHDPQRLEQMRFAMRSLARPSAAGEIAAQLHALSARPLR